MAEFDHLIPLHFQVPAFVEAWHDWVADRHERKQAVTERGAKIALNDLARDAGHPATALVWIQASIKARYRGIFPPSSGGRPAAPNARAGADAHLMAQLEGRGQEGGRDGRAPAF